MIACICVHLPGHQVGAPHLPECPVTIAKHIEQAIDGIERAITEAKVRSVDLRAEADDLDRRVVVYAGKVESLRWVCERALPVQR